MSQVSEREVLATNYAAHALEALRDLSRQMPSTWIHSCADLRVLQALIRQSEKFLLPPNGELLFTREYREPFFDLMQLPYPVIALEIPVTKSDNLDGNSVSKSLIIAWTKESGCSWPSVVDADDAINFTEMVYFDNMWQIRPGICGFSPSSPNFQGGKTLAMSGCPAFEEYFEVCSRHEIETDLGGMFSSGFNALLEFCLTVNCENVAQERLEPSKVMNQSRVSKGKTPFFTYRFLRIPALKVDSVAAGATHSSPRMHLRRGHLRRLQTGKVTWVRNTIVGNPELGAVEKTYVVR